MLLPFIGADRSLGSSAITRGALLAFCAYYSVYETLHGCRHQPVERSLERTGFFFRLNGHHLLHHRYMRKNFNVVLPLADRMPGYPAAAFRGAFRPGDRSDGARRAASHHWSVRPERQTSNFRRG